jgi:hypothetical protein
MEREVRHSDSFTAVFATSPLPGKKMEECHGNAVDVSACAYTQYGAIVKMSEKFINLWQKHLKDAAATDACTSTHGQCS